MNSSSDYKVRESGGVAFAVMLLLALQFIFVFVAAFLTSVMSASALSQRTDAGQEASSSPLESSAAPADVVPVGDIGTGGLAEVNLPNVTWPKVPALDRRVKPMLFGTLKSLQSEGVKNVTFNYFFRTTAQQSAITPVGTTQKATPGTSDHERGTAIDVAGMRARGDAGLIVEAFKRSGFNWQGQGDAAHFFVPAWKLGEPDKHAFLLRQQQDYQSGAWRNR